MHVGTNILLSFSPCYFCFSFSPPLTSTMPSDSKPESDPSSAAEAASKADPNSDASKERKHDDGAADLEKVTDYAEEKEILSTSTDIEDAMANISKSRH